MQSLNKHLITREIGIDMGHRVTHHGSKCKNLHGHRYTIQATCEGPLFTEGEQQGMVLDFGFLKDEMMKHIDVPCDHGTCLWVEDPFTKDFTGYNNDDMKKLTHVVKTNGGVIINSKFGKLYVVNFVPTAENLAKHWFELLIPAVASRTDNQAKLVQIKVWETPNCSASYPGSL